jgi:hypothetical protein
MLDDITNGLDFDVETITRLLESNKVIAGLVVVPEGGLLPQTAVPGQPGDLVRPPNVGGAGGGAGRFPSSEKHFGPLDAGRAIVPSEGAASGFEGPPAAPETRAGLLSLPVHVPEQGVVHRFEKLNGGARLEVSVGTPGAGRGLVALALFAVAALVLLLTPRLLRRR